MATRRERAVPYAFLAPAVVFFVLFIALPVGYAGYLSLRRTQIRGLGLGRGARREIWAGLDNYGEAVTDSALWGGALRVLGYGALLVPTMLALALLFALLLDRPRAVLHGFSRISIFLPYAIPAVIATVLWGFLYAPALSPFQYLLDLVGGPRLTLLEPGWLLYSVANIGLWGGVGFNMIVIYTSLRAIPPEIYDSARLDGCGELQLALRIKIPLVVPSLIMTGLFTVVATLQVFSEPTTLRPLTNALPSDWTPLMKVYSDAFERDDIYSAAATSILIALITLVVSLVFLRLVAARAFAGEHR